MATISFAGATQTQITVNIGHNGSVVDNFDLYRDGSVLVSSGPFASSTTHSTQRTATGLSPGKLYGFNVNYYRGSTFVATASGSWRTDDPPPPPVPGATRITGFGYGNPKQYVPTTVTVDWSVADGATSYDYQVVGLGISDRTTLTRVSFPVTVAGSYNFTVYPRNSSGQGIGDSKTFTLYGPPNAFQWDFPKVPGESVKVSALEWNSFIKFVNEFRDFKLQPPYSFSSAVLGGAITADNINQARNAIASMNPGVSIPDFCSALRTDVSAYYFNRLRDSVNSVK